ncbi:MAG: host-nuclease inhibitor Gam family protein [Opitutales bacterium]|nr:host-nuclease inhibitor Gam family protein [Opitutales bacterium]
MPRTNSLIQYYNSRDEFESDIDQIALLQLKREQLKAARDIESQKILHKYNSEIRVLDATIEAIQLRALPYAQQNRERLFGKQKSASCSLAIYGFKLGNKSLVNISGESDEIAAKMFLANGRPECVTTVYKLNKDAIKRALKNGDVVVSNSFKFEQSERFFVEAKTDKEAE